MQVLLLDWSAPDTEEHLEPLFCDLEEAAARRQEAAEAGQEAQARTEVHGVPADVVLAGPSARHGAHGQGGNSNGGDSAAAKYDKCGKCDSVASKYGKCDSIASKYGNGGSAAAALPPRLQRCDPPAALAMSAWASYLPQRCYPPAALARVFRLCGLTIGWYADCMLIAC